MSEFKDESGHPYWGQEPTPPNSKIISDSGKVEEMVCGCGRQGRYIDPSNGKSSCNKNKRCPTYEQLEKINKELYHDILMLLEASNDVTTFRESTKPYNKANFVIEELISKYDFNKRF